MKNFISNMRKVVYKGEEVYIPYGFKYIATDVDGEVYAFALEPCQPKIGYWIVGEGNFFKLGEFDRISDKESKDSLEYYPN